MHICCEIYFPVYPICINVRHYKIIILWERGRGNINETSGIILEA